MAQLSKPRRGLLLTFAGLVVVLGCGYFSARVTLPHCTELTRAAAVAADVRGVDLGGRVHTATDVKIHSTPDYPFVVRSRFSIPRDLHASVHVYRYFVFFGHAVPFGHEIVSPI